MIIAYLETSSVITENGIRVKKVNKNIITWGQIQSYQIIDDLTEQKFKLTIKYIVRNSNSLENEEIFIDSKHKFEVEVEQILCGMKSLFNKKDSLPLQKLLYIKRISLGLIFAVYFISIFSNIDLFT